MPRVRLYKFIAVFIVLSISMGCVGCQRIYSQWYFENRRSEGVRVYGPFDRVFIIPPCSANYYAYINHVKKTFEEAKTATYRIENVGTYVSEDDQQFSTLKAMGMLRIVLTGPDEDVCAQPITDTFQIQVTNNSSGELGILLGHQLIGSVPPNSTNIVGPIKGVISQYGITLMTKNNSNIHDDYVLKYPGWQLGNVPTLQIYWPQP